MRIECPLIECRHEFAAAPERRAVERESRPDRMLSELEKMAVASRRLHEDRASVHGCCHDDLRVQPPANRSVTRRSSCPANSCTPGSWPIGETHLRAMYPQ